MTDPHRFHGKTALITGASKRLGRETALALAGAGTNLAIHYNSSEASAQDLVQELLAMDVEAMAVQADLRDPAESQGLFHEVWEAQGSVDYLVNNASIFPAGRLDEIDFQEVQRNLQVNAWAPFLLIRSFWRQIRGTQNRGSVVNLLDTRLVGGDLAHAAYHLSKAALAEITTLAALEFAPELRVNGVAPGAVLPPEDKDEEYLEGLTAELPLRKRGYPVDIAEATLYLLEATFVTGQVIFVDGGRHIRLGGST